MSIGPRMKYGYARLILACMLTVYGSCNHHKSSFLKVTDKINTYLLILRAGQLSALVEYTSRLEGNKLVSDRTNQICTSNKYCNKYNGV